MNTTVLQGIATLDIATFVSGLQQIRQEIATTSRFARESFAEINTALSGLNGKGGLGKGLEESSKALGASVKVQLEQIRKEYDLALKDIQAKNQAMLNESKKAAEGDLAQKKAVADATRQLARAEVDGQLAQTKASAEAAKQVAKANADTLVITERGKQERLNTEAKAGAAVRLTQARSESAQIAQEDKRKTAAAQTENTIRINNDRIAGQQQLATTRSTLRQLELENSESAKRTTAQLRSDLRIREQDHKASLQRNLNEERKASREIQQARRATMGSGGGRDILGTSQGMWDPFGGDGSGGMDQWARQLKVVEDRYNSIFRAGSQIQQLGFMTTVLTGATSAFGMSLVEGVKDFDSWIAKAYLAAQAIGDLGVSREQFEESAYRISQAIGSFDPTKVAETYFYWMAAQGEAVKGNEDLMRSEGALTAVLMASSMAKADSTMIIRGLVSVLNQFGLSSDRAVDTIAKLYNASQISAVEMNELIESFKMLGPIAGNTGISLEEILAVVTGLADVGQRGSMSGRGLMQVITSLIRPSDQAAEALTSVFKAAGLVQESYTEAFFEGDRFVGFLDKVNEDGTIHVGILGKLAEATKNMTQEEKLRFEAIITSQNGMRALIPLLESYEQGVNAGNKAMEERFARFRDHEGQIESMREQWATMGNTIEVAFGQQANRIQEFFNSVGSVIAYALLPFITYLADIADLILRWAQANPELFTGIISLVTGITVLGGVLAGVLFIIGQYLQAFAVWQIVSRNVLVMVGAITSSWLSFGLAIGTAIMAIIAISTAFRENFGEAQSVVEGFSEFLRVTASGIVQSVGWFIQMVAAMLTDDWDLAWEYAANIMSAIGVVIQTAVLNLGPIVISALGAVLESVGRLIDQFIPGFFDWGKALMLSFSQGIIAAANVVLQAALSIIGVIASLFEAHSPPKEGPLRYIEDWGMELMNTFMRGMKKADFKIVNDVADLIEKNLDMAMREGRITPEEYFTRNMGARQVLAQYSSRVRHTAETGVAPLSSDEQQWMMDELRRYAGTGNEFVDSMMDAYLNLAPLETVIELEKEKLDVLKNQKNELEAQIDVRKAELGLANLGDDEEYRMVQAELDIMRARHDIEETKFRSLPNTKENRDENERRRQARDAMQAEEAALRQRLAEIELRRNERELQYLKDTAPQRLEAARLELEARKQEAAIAQKQVEAKPWQEKLEAAQAAVAHEEKIYQLAKKAADEEDRRLKAAEQRAKTEQEGFGISGTGDGGEKFRQDMQKIQDDLDKQAKEWAEKFRKTVMDGFENALVPFTKFTDGVEKDRLRMKESLDNWRQDVQDFLDAMKALMGGGDVTDILYSKEKRKKQRYYYDVDRAAWDVEYSGEMVDDGEEDYYRRRNLPPWFEDMVMQSDDPTNPQSPRDQFTDRAGRVVHAGAVTYLTASALIGEQNAQSVNRNVRAVGRHLSAMGALGVDEAGEPIPFMRGGRLGLAEARVIRDLSQADPVMLRRIEQEVRLYGRVTTGTADEIRSGPQRSRALQRIVQSTDGEVPLDFIRDIRRLQQTNPEALDRMIQTGEAPVGPLTRGRRLLSNFVRSVGGAPGGFMNRVSGAIDPYPGTTTRPSIRAALANRLRETNTYRMLFGEAVDVIDPDTFSVVGQPRGLTPRTGGLIPRIRDAATRTMRSIGSFLDTPRILPTDSRLVPPPVGNRPGIYRTFSYPLTGAQQVLPIEGGAPVLTPRQWVRAVAQNIDDTARGAQEGVVGRLGQVRRGIAQSRLGRAVGAATDIVPDFLDEAVMDYAEGAGGTRSKVQVPRGRAIARAFGEIPRSVVGKPAGRAAAVVSRAGARVGGAVTSVARPVGQTVRGAGRAVGGVARGAGRAVGAGGRAGGAALSGGVSVLSSILGIVKDFVGLHVGVGKFVGKLLGLNKLGSAGGHVAGIVSGIANFIGHASGLTPVAKILGRILRIFGRFLPVVGIVMTIIDIIQLLHSAWTNNFAGIQDIVAEAWSKIEPAINNISSALEQLQNGTISISEFLELIGPEIEKILTALWDAIKELSVNLLDELVKLFNSIWEWIKTDGLELVGKLAEWIGQLLGGMITWLSENWQTIVTDLVYWLTRLFLGPASLLYHLGDWAITKGIPALVEWLSNFIKDFFGGGQAGAENDEGILQTFVKVVEKAIKSLVDWITSPQAATDIRNAIESVFGFFLGIWDSVARAFSDSFTITRTIEVETENGNPDAPVSGAYTSSSGRHSGGGIDRTGWYFLDQGEWVLNANNVQSMLRAAHDMRNLSYNLERGSMLGGAMNVGGNVRIDVNLNGNAANLDPRLKEEIAATVVKGISDMFR